MFSLRPSNKIPGTYAIRARSQGFTFFPFHKAIYHRRCTIWGADSDVKQTTTSIYNPISRCKPGHVTVHRLKLADPSRCSRLLQILSSEACRSFPVFQTAADSIVWSLQILPGVPGYCRFYRLKLADPSRCSRLLQILSSEACRSFPVFEATADSIVWSLQILPGVRGYCRFYRLKLADPSRCSRLLQILSSDTEPCLPAAFLNGFNDTIQQMLR